MKGGKAPRVGVGLAMEALEMHAKSSSASMSSSGEERRNSAIVGARDASTIGWAQIVFLIPLNRAKIEPSSMIKSNSKPPRARNQDAHEISAAVQDG